VEEHPGKFALHSAEPVQAAPLAPQQRFVLAPGPLLKPLIDVPRDLVHRRPIERPIIIPPPAYRRITLLRQFGQCRRGLSINAPAPHRLPHTLQGIRTHTRQKTGEHPVLSASRLPGPKCEAEEREVYVWIRCSTFTVLAVDHLRLLRMHRQPTLRQPQCDGPHCFFRLLPAAAVDHRVIGITGKWAEWMGTLHPGVERVVHEQIHQDR